MYPPMPCPPPPPILSPHMLAVNQTSFFHPKNVESLILNWGGQLTQTKQLIAALSVFSPY